MSNCFDRGCNGCEACIDPETQAPEGAPGDMVLVPRELIKDAAESVDDYRCSLEFGAHDRKLLGRLKAALAAPAPQEWRCPDTGRLCTAEDCDRVCFQAPAEGDATRRGLLPCPFCGRRPVLTVRPDNAEATSYFAAVACFCGGYAACAHKDATASEADEAERLAREKWNGRAAHPQPKGTPFQLARVADLVAKLRDTSGGHINGLYDAQAADLLEEMATLADSEGTRAVEYLRRARKAEAALKTQAPAPGADAEGGDMPCPRCNGSGFELQWSDASPDAHQVEVNCDHCDGAGSLGAAYTHLSQMLKRERERSKKHTDELHWLKSGPFFGLRADKSIQTVADRLDELADACGKYDPRSERASDIRAAATIWRKHLAGPAPCAAVAPITPETNKEFGDPRRAMNETELQEFCIALSFEQDDYTTEVIRAVESRMLAKPLFLPTAQHGKDVTP